MTDTVADFLIRIKNAYMAGLKEVCVPYSSLKERLGKILVDLGYISSVDLEDKKALQKVLVLKLKYKAKRAALKDIRRISKPSLRVYVSSKDIRQLPKKFSTQIISTPKGLMTGDEAKKKKLGGEIICQVW